MSSPYRQGHRFLEHTSEERLRVQAGTLAELLSESGRGLARLLIAGKPPRATGPWREIEVTSRDREALVVDWLNELIYLAETELWVATEFEMLDCCDTSVRARARGVQVEHAPSLVKAATHHGLQVERGIQIHDC